MSLLVDTDVNHHKALALSELFIVMALADRLETKLIFGFDAVFEQNGYRPQR